MPNPIQLKDLETKGMFAPRPGTEAYELEMRYNELPYEPSEEEFLKFEARMNELGFETDETGTWLTPPNGVKAKPFVFEG